MIVTIYNLKRLIFGSSLLSLPGFKPVRPFSSASKEGLFGLAVIPYKDAFNKIAADTEKKNKKKTKQEAKDWNKNKQRLISEYGYTESLLFGLTPWQIAEELEKLDKAQHSVPTASFTLGYNRPGLEVRENIALNQVKALLELRDAEAVQEAMSKVPILRTANAGIRANLEEQLGNKEAAKAAKLEAGIGALTDIADTVFGYRSPISLATTYVGDWAGRYIGDRYFDSPDAGGFIGAMTGSFIPGMILAGYRALAPHSNFRTVLNRNIIDKSILNSTDRKMVIPSTRSSYNVEDLMRDGTFKMNEDGIITYTDPTFNFEAFLKSNPEVRIVNSPGYTSDGISLKDIKKFYNETGLIPERTFIRNSHYAYIPIVGSTQIPRVANLNDIEKYTNEVLIPTFKKWGVSESQVRQQIANAPNSIYYRPVSTYYRLPNGLMLRRDPLNGDMIGGWHNRSTNENFINLESWLKDSYKGVTPVEKSKLHEERGHGTEEIVPELVRRIYDRIAKLFTEKSKDFPNVDTWRELRAVRHLLGEMLYKNNISLDDLEKLPDEEILDMLYNTGGYGRNYVSNIKQMNPELLKNAVDYIKRMLTLPAAAGIIVGASEYKIGGKLIPKGKKGIHIKKENKGKFTEYCNGKVTSECILKGKNSSDPKIRKRATFAANIRKWNKKK